MNFFFKIILFPLIIYLATLTRGASLPLVTIFSLAGILVMIGIIAEPIFLPRFGNLVSTLMGTIFIIFFLWITPLLLGQGVFNFEIALITGLILGLIEFILHHVFIMTDN